MLALLVPSGASAAVHLDSIGTFDAPVNVASLPGEPDRLLVVEQGGTIQLVDHGVASTFLDLTNPRIVSAGGERGLLSVAPAPDYATSHHLYVYFTNTSGSIEIDEFTADGDSVPLSSRRPLLVIPHPNFSNHNGGQLQFGPDGMLYAGTGDGGSAGDPSGNAQNLNSLLGKILRIDPHPSGSSPYTVPAGNPFPGSLDLVVRAAQPVAFLVRPHDRRSADRGRGPGRARGGRLLRRARPGARSQLRLELPRGTDRVPKPRRGVRRARRLRRSRSTTTTTTAWAARSSAAMSSATRASATSTAATLFSDNCDGTIRSLVPGHAVRPRRRRRRVGLERHRARRASARTPAGGVYVAALGAATSRGSRATPRRVSVERRRRRRATRCAAAVSPPPARSPPTAPSRVRRATT